MSNIRVARIQLVPRAEGTTPQEMKESQTKIWQILHSLQKTYYKMANEAITALFVAESAKSFMSKEQFKEIVCSNKSEQTLAYSATQTYQQDGDSMFRSALASRIWADWKNHRFEIKTGQRALETYKKTMPLYFNKQIIFTDSKKKTSTNFTNKGVDMPAMELKFDFVLGKNLQKRSVQNAVQVIDQISKNSDLMSDSALQIKDNKIYLLLSYKLPKKEKPALYKTATINAGMVIPICMAVQEDGGAVTRIDIGTVIDYGGKKTTLVDLRQELQEEYNESKIYSRFNRGGHGRGRKYIRKTGLSAREANIIAHYAHLLSKEVVTACVNNRVKTLVLEDLTGFAEQSVKKAKKKAEKLGQKSDFGKVLGYEVESKSEFILKHWGYYKIQQQIKNKFEAEGGEIKWRNPANASITCSDCGHCSEENYQVQAVFRCVSCGAEKNGDFNNCLNGLKADFYEKKK